MRLQHLKAILKAAASGAAVLLMGVGGAAAQQQINLTAEKTTALLPDGVSVPMWGYTCGATTGGSATCALGNATAANPNPTGWSPVIITVPAGETLTIKLTNSLPGSIPTSLVIVGQLGGGLGTDATSTDSPDHTHSPTWPIADPTNVINGQPQGKRVQSFGTEVAVNATTSLTWANMRPGTYLLESGTHPSIQASMGLIGMVVVTPTVPVADTADAKLIFSEIDPVQNSEVDAAVNTPGFSETNVWSGLAGGCGAKLNADGTPNTTTYHTCYPPVVNYKPLYYLINGVSFSRANPANSQIAASASVTSTGQVLVRMVNAGLRMHVPTIVGSTTKTPPVGGFSLIAEDGNPLPGIPRVQSEVFMAAGKTYDVMINAPAAGGTALPVFDREGSLSANATTRDAGMLAYLSVNGAALPTVDGTGTVKANADTYPAVIPGKTLTISDPALGVIANDVNIMGVKAIAPIPAGLALNEDGTFTYDATGWSGPVTFTYCGNGATTLSAPNSCATVSLSVSTAATGDSITHLCDSDLNNHCTWLSTLATTLTVKAPGLLEGAVDAKSLPLSVDTSSVSASSPAGLTITLNKDGSFTASGTPGVTYTFTFKAKSDFDTESPATATGTIIFPQPSHLAINVVDGTTKEPVSDGYRWIIEEDRTFFSDPKCRTNPPSDASCPGYNSTNPSLGTVPNFGTNFHTSFMPVVASGCTDAVPCGDGQFVKGVAIAPRTPSLPGDVGLCPAPPTTPTTPPTPAPANCLDPHKRYYISVLPGDAAQPFIAGYGGAPDCSDAGKAAGSCGHGMGGAPIPVQTSGSYSPSSPITVVTEPSPYPPATLSVFVFQDDYPLNGEHDAGGGIDVLSPNEAGLGGFQITIADDAGGTGDATGTPTYDMFNMPLSNSLAGTIDPVTHLDACPLSKQATDNAQQSGPDATPDQCAVDNTLKGCQRGMVGMILTCPKYESDGSTLSPLAGQAVVKNLWQGRYGVIANPGADRIAAGEEWLQTNTLDGQKAHDSFMRIGEPAYFQEFGPAGYHVSIGFASPQKIAERFTGLNMCQATTTNQNPCPYTVKGHVTTARMSRTPDERLYGSETHDSYAFTQCYISLGDPDGPEFKFTKCDAEGNFQFTGVPQGNWKITTFDQWNDQVVDGITTPVAAGAGCAGNTCDLGEVAVHQWQSNIYTRTFIDTDYSGVSPVDAQGNPTKPGLALVDTNIRFRDGSFSNFNNTDLDGFAGFNEVFPLFNWYVVETDTTRYKSSGTHVVYDSGGPVDNSAACGDGMPGNAKKCGTGTIIADHLANTYEPYPLPADLSVPGAVYCADADCTGTTEKISQAVKADGTLLHPAGANSTSRIDPPWVSTYGWQGYSGQNNFLEFGKRPFADGENGGIYGHVVYASTRPFDDPQLLLQLSWEPQIPHVQINLYKEGLATDGVTPTLTLVDHTLTSSFDDWAQGFRKNADGSLYRDLAGNYIPNMNCPGQGDVTGDPYFFFALNGQKQYLDQYANGGAATPLPYNSQYKCYDGMHNWNQLQPAPYDGAYRFPSTTIDPANGKVVHTDCTACVTNPDSTDLYRYGGPTKTAWVDGTSTGTPMLPAGKYVVEVVVPDGYELVKEEDKNILIGDNYIAPVVQQFGPLGSIYIMPDQAEVANSYNPLNSTGNLGRTTLPSHEADTGSVETFWPCVGADHIVPDFISLFPGSQENAPFAGATRKLCDRKEVTLNEQTSALAKFYLFSETHTASHFTGVITDDFTAEFDPFSPQFGEKFGPAYLPVSFKDWAGNEITRVYSDAWGAYNGLNYSTWEVNPPNPTGYGPTMMVGCMNDAGPVNGAVDPYFQDGYSQFCYELPFMPGQTGYFDTPVVPTSAFAGGYNNPDCSYPDATPAIARVDGDGGTGPWIAGLKGTITAINLVSGGSGYVTAPSVTIGAPTTGTTATATAVISGSVTSVSVTNPGLYNINTHPTITIGAPAAGVTATATPVMSASPYVVLSVTMTDNGTGYTNTAAGRPTVVFNNTGTGGTGAAGTANVNFAGRVSGVTITNRGSGYTSAPSVSFQGGSGRNATGRVNLGNTVSSVNVTNGGTGYTGVPTVTFSNAPTGGIRAQGNAFESGSVVALNLTASGSGYTSAPSVTIAAPASGTTATANATIEANGTITIKSLGLQMVDNYQYTGPGAIAAPFNSQKIQRNYGFGGTAGTVALVDSLNVSHALTNVSWSNDTITGQVPSGVANCGATTSNPTGLQQQAQFGGSTAQCGELVITTAPDPITHQTKSSVDTVTVTIGGKAPTIISPGATLTASGFGAIQQAIDKASPGDLLIVSPGTYSEMILMWKPVRLQGVGAATSIIDANPHPAGKLNPWRQRVVCLFGLALNGIPISNANPFNPDTTPGSASCSGDMKFSVDRLPLEATVGWDATLNGNLAEQLIEPTLMGAYEGAGITVLGKGVWFPNGGADAFAADTFPTGTTLLDGTSNTTRGCGPNGTAKTNPFPGNFYCNPSRIDGVTIQNSSQGGGAIWAHAWNHNLEIANNRIINNQGTMSGGITIGQGEHPDAFLAQSGTATIPGSCIPDGNINANMALPYCNNVDVNVHHNYVTLNSSLGDELFSSTPAGAGGATFCNGSDYYKFNYNWVCGNMSTGDGAGVAHVGFTYDGHIEHNTILFNQSTNPTIVTNGAGLLVMGAPDQDPPCALLTDQDCVSPPNTILPSDGAGPGLVINANLILGNSAESGSGGGLRLQHINGTDVLNFPNANFNNSNTGNWPRINTTSNPHDFQPSFQLKTRWNAVSVTNNIIANNVAGIDGGGVSLLDALAVDFVNNTVVKNNSTATSGVLLQTLFAPLASTDPGGAQVDCGNGQSCPQVAGLVSVQNSLVLTGNINLPGAGTVTCPTNHGVRGGAALNPPQPDCLTNSVPALYNDVFWQNRATVIGVGGPSGTLTNQQSAVSVLDPTTTFTGAGTGQVNQSATGSCNDNNARYWDIGVRGDSAPSNHSGGRLAPAYSFLSDVSPYPGANNQSDNPNLTAMYCNGSRVPVEAGFAGNMAGGSGTVFPGWEVPPGTNESNALPGILFNLSPAATVDEGNNWINLRWGPLSTNLTTTNLNAAPATLTSPPVDKTPSNAGTAYSLAPTIDFFGNARKTTTNPAVDAGAIEVGASTGGGGGGTPSATLTPTTRNFGTHARVCPGTTLAQIVACAIEPIQAFTLTNTGTVPLTGIGHGTIGGANPTEFTVVNGLSTCGAAGNGQLTGNVTLAPGANCVITVQFKPQTNLPASTTPKSATVSVTDLAGTQTSTLSGTANP